MRASIMPSMNQSTAMTAIVQAATTIAVLTAKRPREPLEPLEDSSLAPLAFVMTWISGWMATGSRDDIMARDVDADATLRRARSGEDDVIRFVEAVGSDFR